MTILPGWVWLRAARIRTRNPCEEAVYCFAASLILNHWLVYFLTVIGQNGRSAWLAIAAAEAVLLVILIRPWTEPPFVFVPAAQAAPVEPTFISVGLAALALATVLALIRILFDNWGTVFTSNDDVLSWDRWAQDWFLKRWPVGPDLYPQLLPANWSVTYALMRTTDVKMFAKAIMPFFGVAILLLFVSLAWSRKERVYLAGCSIAGFLFLQYLGRDSLMTGYVDVALAFFCFLPFYVLYQEESGAPGDARILSLFFAAGAALTKQGGLLTLAALALYLVTKRKSTRDPSATPVLRWSAVFALVFLALWYAPKFYSAFHGRSNLGFVLHDIHAGRNYVERLWFGSRLIIDAGGRPGLFFFAIGAGLTLGGLLFSKTRKLTIGIVLPACLLWGAFFSYEVRTGALLVPFLALLWCLTLGNVLAGLEPHVALRGPAAYWTTAILLLAAGIFLFYDGGAVPRIQVNYTWPLVFIGLCLTVVPVVPVVQVTRRLRSEISVPGLATGLAVLIGLAAWPKYSDRHLMDQQLAAQRMLGNPAVNAMLYRLYDAGQLHEPILSGYWFLESLPELKSLSRNVSCGDCSVPTLLRTIAVNRNAGFLLLEDAILPSSTAGMIAHCAGIEPVFTVGTVRLFRLDRSKLRDTCFDDLETIRPVIEKLYPSETLAGHAFNIQSSGLAAFGVACRNASASSVLIWSGTQLVSAYGGPKSMSAEVPPGLYAKPGHYPVKILDKATGLESPSVNFDVK